MEKASKPVKKLIAKNLAKSTELKQIKVKERPVSNREQQKQLTGDLILKVFVFSHLETEIYTILKSRKINLALLAESLGMQRNTAYYRLKKKCFPVEDLMRLAEKAKEIYYL